jgi:hypothetical protein
VKAKRYLNDFIFVIFTFTVSIFVKYHAVMLLIAWAFRENRGMEGRFIVMGLGDIDLETV